MLEVWGFQRIYWHYANKTLFMNKWSNCTPLKRMTYCWLLASHVFCACANQIGMAPVHPHTHTAGKLSIKPFCAAFCCNSCILRHLPKGGAVLLLTVVTRLSWAAFTNRKQGVSKLKMYIAKHGGIGPVYINKMLINASGNHLSQQTMIESEGVGPWVLETTKETLCTQRFLCAEYQWRTAMHNQRLKVSFHSLTFLPTGAQTAEPARWER